MDENTFNIITKQWDRMSNTVLNLKKIPPAELQRLLKDTYEILTFYHKFDVVPKEVARLLLAMDHYLYFSTLMEDKEVDEGFYYYQAVDCVVRAMEKGFFQGAYECAFPVLKVYDPMGKVHVLDLENGSLEELI